jgi:hypothetical protein
MSPVVTATRLPPSTGLRIRVPTATVNVEARTGEQHRPTWIALSLARVQHERNDGEQDAGHESLDDGPRHVRNAARRIAVLRSDVVPCFTLAYPVNGWVVALRIPAHAWA